ncbi:lipopolysaccharide biosynthesis protein [Geodermatophilus sabuli]|uniref:Polysaccharide transporter, PST family n=1 Tax=Geodermatophilus sabuli TaxID=1564158 RepID=A0A285EJY7_9ACTN|nr:lipopolysaccharide biosynthesis protein [Geodermatophilus sabuli]MBB3087068.1 PST family polysaccharide transporter [Geodermatophilus sabuli]SNX99405.1 polysaccharide transporter, PST family [Geodermatophilus sabuli]
MSGRTRDAAPEPTSTGDTPVAAPEADGSAGPRVDARTAGSSFFWSAVSFTASKLLVFVVTLVMARLLVPEDFGVVSVGLAIVAFLEVALDLGVGSALVYEQERGITPRVQTAFTLNLGIAAVCTLAGVLAAPAVAEVFDVDDTNLLRVLFLYFLLRGLVQVPDAVLRRDLAFRRRALVEVSRAVARGAVSVPLAVAGAGPWALVVGILASEGLGVVLTWWATRFFPTFRLDTAVARTLLGFGTAVLTLKILGAVLENADYYIVGAKLGPYDLGIYTLAYRVPEIVLANVFWIFSSVAFSIYSRARSDDASELGTVATRALQLITLFAFPAGVGVAVVSMPLTVALLGWEWEDAAGPMFFVALSMAASSIGYASGDVFPAVGRPGLLIKIVAPMVVVKVTGLLLAAPFGLTAMAATLFGMSVVFAAVRLTVANRLLSLPASRSLRAMMPGTVAAIGAGAAALPIVLSMEPEAETLALAIPAGILGAGAMLLLFCRPVLRELSALAASMRRPKSNA